MVWARMHWPVDALVAWTLSWFALVAWTLSWFGHGCTGQWMGCGPERQRKRGKRGRWSHILDSTHCGFNQCVCVCVCFCLCVMLHGGKWVWVAAECRTPFTSQAKIRSMRFTVYRGRHKQDVANKSTLAVPCTKGSIPVCLWMPTDCVGSGSRSSFGLF